MWAAVVDPCARANNVLYGSTHLVFCAYDPSRFLCVASFVLYAKPALYCMRRAYLVSASGILLFFVRLVSPCSTCRKFVLRARLVLCTTSSSRFLWAEPNSFCVYKTRLVFHAQSSPRFHTPWFASFCMLRVHLILCARSMSSFLWTELASFLHSWAGLKGNIFLGS